MKKQDHILMSFIFLTCVFLTPFLFSPLSVLGFEDTSANTKQAVELEVLDSLYYLSDPDNRVLLPSGLRDVADTFYDEFQEQIWISKDNERVRGKIVAFPSKSQVKIGRASCRERV